MSKKIKAPVKVAVPVFDQYPDYTDYLKAKKEEKK